MVSEGINGGRSRVAVETHNEEVVERQTDEGSVPVNLLLSEEVVGDVGDVAALGILHAEPPENVTDAECGTRVSDAYAPVASFCVSF